MTGSFSSTIPVILSMAMASAPISWVTAGGMMTSASGIPTSPSSEAFLMDPFLSGGMTPMLLSAFFPAYARSLISMFSNRDIWKVLPQTPILLTCVRSIPSAAKRLLAAFTISPWATSSPDWMAKLTWSMTFIPGMG